MPSPARRLVARVTRRFAPAGTFARIYAREKLLRDPIYFALLERGLIPRGARVLDLGCGQGILLALLVAAREASLAGEWPDAWAAPPTVSRLRGIERDSREAGRARTALGGEAEIEELDLCEAKLPESDLVALIDVIHYLAPAAQERLLARAVEALAPGGVLLLRVCDSGRGVRALMTRLGDHLGTLTKLGRIGRLHLRGVAEWRARLEVLGLSVEPLPMSAGTPFANVLLVARRPRAG